MRFHCKYKVQIEYPRGSIKLFLTMRMVLLSVGGMPSTFLVKQSYCFRI